MEWYLKVMKNHYADFNGRARRKEYWMFGLFYMIIMIVLTILDNMTGLAFTIPTGYGEDVSMGYGWLYCIGGLIHFVPAIAVTIRRLHDQDKSGWYCLISFIPFVGVIWLLVLLCTEGNKGTNRFGSDPK